MRFIVLLCFIVCSIAANTQNISKETEVALKYLYSGYTEYGIKMLVKSAKLNDLSAQYYLAVCYEYGLVVQKDEKEAFNLYRRTAERGLSDAMYKIAMFYKNGVIVAQSEAKSSEWYQRFKRRGGKNTMLDLVQIYKEGLKYPANYSLNPSSSVNSMTINNNESVSSATSTRNVFRSPKQPKSTRNNHL